MDTEIGDQIRKIIQDKIKYLDGVATDYALRYANSDEPEAKIAYLKYKFAAEQLENIRTRISIEVNNLENFLGKES